MDNDGRIYELETHLIQLNPLQPRGVITPDSLTELVDSIREQGILEPLVVADTPAGYQSPSMRICATYRQKHRV